MFELATPIGVFGPHRSAVNDLPLNFSMAALNGTSARIEGGIDLAGLVNLDDVATTADMIIIPTWPIATEPVPPRLVETLIAAHDNGARLVGLCLGAFAAAATGLLDTQAATTHWRYRDQFQTDYPSIRFEPNSLYVDLDTCVTSAGSAAALDCCIHLLRRDHGADVASRVARSMVTAPHRDGTQSQFASTPAIHYGNDPMSSALSTASEQIADISGVADLAAIAGTSRRSLERHMRDRLGTTPAAWIDEQRIILASRLLETTDQSVEVIAAHSGYGSSPTLRRAFRSHRGTTPTSYRAAFRPPAGRP